MRNTFSLRQLFLSVLVVGGPLLSAAASAGELWMLLGDGDKLESGITPNRVMHFAYAGNIRDRTDQSAKIAEITRDPNPKTINMRLKALEVQEMDVVEIYENASAPGFRMLTMQFQCTKKLHRILKAEAKERNSLHRFSGATEWQPYVATDWQSRAYFLACAKEIWEPMAKAEIEQMQQKKAVTKQTALRDYGVGIIGAWPKDEGLNQVYRLTWDRIWAGSAKPVPFHHNRNTAEEAEYQAWKKGNDAVIAQNKKDAPALLAAIGDLEGKTQNELKAADTEQAFILQVNKNFKAKPKMAQKVFFGTEGFSEEEIVARWGVPDSVLDYAGIRAIKYRRTIDTRQTHTTYEKNVVVGSGQGIDPGYSAVTTETGGITECVLTLHLKPGGSKPGYRLTDYEGDVCVWDISGFLE
jgi:hypothetical protein